MGLLGAVLRGVGGWMVHEAQVQEEFNLAQMKADILASREVALENLRAQHQSERDATQHANELEQIDRTGEQNRLTSLTQGAVQARRDEANDARDLEKSITLKGIDLKNDTALEKFRHQNDLSEIQARAAADLQNSLTEAGQTVDRIVFTKDGRGVAYSKLGKKIGETGAGIFNPTGSDGSEGGDDLGSYLNSGGRSSGSSISRTKAEPTPKLKGQDPVLAQLQRAPPPPDGKVGRTMTGPKGMKARWNGKQWVLEDINGGQ